MGPITITVSDGTALPSITNVPCTGPGSSQAYIFPTPLQPGVYAVNIEGLDADLDGLVAQQGTEICIQPGVPPTPITVNLTTAYQHGDPLAAICR